MLQDNPALNITAEAAAAEEGRTKDKKAKAAAWGWEAFNQDNLYKVPAPVPICDS